MKYGRSVRKVVYTKLDAETKFEIDCRKLLVKRLQTPKNTLVTACDREANAYSERIGMLTEFKSADEAHEAYGWGIITESEYEQVRDLFEKGEQIRNGRATPSSAALQMLNEIISHLSREIRDFKWDALPEAEKERIRQSNEKLKAELKNSPLLCKVENNDLMVKKDFVST